MSAIVVEGVSELDLDILTLIGRLLQMDEQMNEEPHWLWTDRVIGCDVPRMLRWVSPAALRWAREETEFPL